VGTSFYTQEVEGPRFDEDTFAPGGPLPWR
jgi:hypothetical protein